MRKRTDYTVPECGAVLTDPNTGLSSQQAAERLEQGLSNAVSDHTSKTAGQIVRSNIFTYFNLIFVKRHTSVCRHIGVSFKYKS